jgi:hypothetical protein
MHAFWKVNVKLIATRAVLLHLNGLVDALNVLNSGIMNFQVDSVNIITAMQMAKWMQ